MTASIFFMSGSRRSSAMSRRIGARQTSLIEPIQSGCPPARRDPPENPAALPSICSSCPIRVQTEKRRGRRGRRAFPLATSDRAC
jgi:hypothetical protein